MAAVSRTLPRHHYEQGEILEALEAYWADQHYNADRLRRFFQNVEVGSRHLALPLERYGELDGFGAKNDAFIEAATDLGARAITEALEAANLEPRDVDAIFFTTITGIATPSIDARIVNALGLRRDVLDLLLFVLIAVLGVVDAIRAAQIETASDFNYTPYVVAGVLFICLTVPMARLTDWFARKQGFHGAGGML